MTSFPVACTVQAGSSDVIIVPLRDLARLTPSCRIADHWLTSGKQVFCLAEPLPSEEARSSLQSGCKT